MKQIGTVFRFTLKNALRSKAFIISTLIVLIILTFMSLVPRMLTAAQNARVAGGDSRSGLICYYLDPSGEVPGALAALRREFPNMEFRAAVSGERARYEEEIRQDGKTSLIIVEKGDPHPAVAILTKDFLSDISGESATRVISREYTAALLAERGFDEDAIALARTELSFTSEHLSKMEANGYSIGLALCVLLFGMIYQYSGLVASSIATEK
ncbi:MAG: hypothetical protein LBQ16_02695, partial [Gracilibacteraceae bacterium]|nr:hypothetical protein [Gracilibacteraceae bacterium]